MPVNKKRKQGGTKRGRRTTFLSPKGKRLNAKRGAKGKFKDIQAFRRTHAAGLRKKSQSETTTNPNTDPNTDPTTDPTTELED